MLQGIRSLNAAAPLKPISSGDRGSVNGLNPQLKRCGTIEAFTYSPSAALTSSSTNPQLKRCGTIEADQMDPCICSFLANPQLKRCGTIEARTLSTKSETALRAGIRSLNAAAPLKRNDRQCLWYRSSWESAA